jgi:RNA methyltransferase, TrmH family
MISVERFRAARRDRALTVLEGFHALKHALRFGAGIEAVALVDPDRLRTLAATLAPDIVGALRDVALNVVDAELFARLAPTPPREPIIAIARRPSPVATASLRAESPLVFLEAPTHLPNIGACVRVAAAAGAAGLVTSGIHDPWHAAALRGSAGLHFALPVLEADEPPADRLLVAMHPDGEPLGARPLPARVTLAFGSERRGLSSDLLRNAERRVAIPMRPGVSSLSLATAVAVALYSSPSAGVAWTSR